MTPQDPLLRLQNENAQLKCEIKRLRAQLLKAYKDRADIHATLRRITSSSSPSPSPSPSSTAH